MPIILRQNEQLIKVARQHVIFLMPAFFSWPFVIVGFLAVRYALGFDFFGYWGCASLCRVLVTMVVLYKYYIWRNNVLIITNQRVVENEQYGFFSKTVTELYTKTFSRFLMTKRGQRFDVRLWRPQDQDGI